MSCIYTPCNSHNHATFPPQCAVLLKSTAWPPTTQNSSRLGSSRCQARYREEDIEAELIDYQGIGSEPGNCCGMRLGETQRHGSCHIYPVGGMRLIV